MQLFIIGRLDPWLGRNARIAGPSLEMLSLRYFLLVLTVTAITRNREPQDCHTKQKF